MLVVVVVFLFFFLFLCFRCAPFALIFVYFVWYFENDHNTQLFSYSMLWLLLLLFSASALQMLLLLSPFCYVLICARKLLLFLLFCFVYVEESARVFFKNYLNNIFAQLQFGIQYCNNCTTNFQLVLFSWFLSAATHVRSPRKFLTFWPKTCE